MWKNNKNNIAVESEKSVTTSCTPLTAIYRAVLRALIHSHSLNCGVKVIKKKEQRRNLFLMLLLFVNSLIWRHLRTYYADMKPVDGMAANQGTQSLSFSPFHARCLAECRLPHDAS